MGVMNPVAGEGSIDQMPTRRLPRLRLGTLFAYLYLFLFLAFLFLPIITVMIFSFNPSRFVVWPPTGFTTDWYQMAFSDESWQRAIRTSLLLGLATVLCAVPLGIAGAYLFTRGRVRGKGIYTTALMTPLIIPAVIIGIALLTFYRSLGIQTGLFTVLLAHVVLSVPYSSLVIAAQMQGFDRSLEEAAYNLGASPLTTFRRITLPILRPGIIASALFAFLISFDEFLITFFVIGTQHLTIPMKIYSNFRFGMTPEMHAVATVATVVSLILLVVAFALSRLYRYD